MGPNTFSEPWHLPHTPPEQISEIVYVYMPSHRSNYYLNKFNVSSILVIAYVLSVLLLHAGMRMHLTDLSMR